MTAPAQPEQAPQLSPGSRLGRYEIVAPLGAGGMGEVWRARDARLGREVAIKVLPRRLTGDAVALQRFEREARAVAALSHPNILAIHDFERDGETHYAVTELLAGESLRERIRRGPAKPRQVREWGTQLARALAAAHDRGIVHRDVKPENVFLTKDGVVKLLDFGLARPQAGPQAETAVAGESSLTTAGMLVGTVGYMAPEQLRGEALDGRADVFALGCVLYELLTGERAFAAKSMAETINAILEHDPPRLETLADTASPELARIVRRCLEKRREQRFQNAHDLAFALEGSEATSAAGGRQVAVTAESVTAVPPARRQSALRLGLGAAVAVALLLAGALVRHVALPAASGAGTVRASLSLAPSNQLVDYTSLALAPDDSAIAFSQIERGDLRLRVRALGEDEGRTLADTEGARYPFWSPDSRQLAFFAGGKLKRTAAAGGPVLTLAAAANARGGSWNREGVIVFSPEPRGGLQTIAATGGTPQPLTRPAASTASHRLPRFLPDGEHLLYVAAHDPGGQNGLYFLTLRSGKSRRLLAESVDAHFAHGHLLYERDGNLVAQPFDPVRGELQGGATVVASGVYRFVGLSQTLGVASDRLLAYLSSTQVDTVLTWLDVDGRVLGKVGKPESWGDLWLSQDGRQAAVMRQLSKLPEIWHVDLAEGIFRRLAAGVLREVAAFSPRGDELLVAREPAPGRFELVVISLRDGSERIVDRGPAAYHRGSWEGDGTTIVYGREADLWSVAADGKSPGRRLAATPAVEAYPVRSPDGRWLAYTSNETGRFELYVARFPALTSRRQLSVDGCHTSTAYWVEGGRALIFADLVPRLRRVAVEERDGETHFGAPTPTFEHLDFNAVADLSFAPDGRRVLTTMPVRNEPTYQLRLVVDWATLLERAP